MMDSLNQQWRLKKRKEEQLKQKTLGKRLAEFIHVDCTLLSHFNMIIY